MIFYHTLKIQATFFFAIANWSSVTFVVTCCFKFTAISSAAFDLDAGLSATFFGRINKINQLRAFAI